MKLCCPLKNVPILTDPPPSGKDVKYGLQKRHPETTGKEAMKSCSLPGRPAQGSSHCQCYCPSCETHKIRGHSGPTGRCVRHHCPQCTLTSLTRVLVFTRKDGIVCYVGGSTPSLPDSESAPQHAKNSSCPNLLVALHRSPAHCCSSPSRTHFPGCCFKDKERVLMFPSQPRSLGLWQKIKIKSQAIRMNDPWHFSELPRHENRRNVER